MQSIGGVIMFNCIWKLILPKCSIESANFGYWLGSLLSFPSHTSTTCLIPNHRWIILHSHLGSLRIIRYVSLLPPMSNMCHTLYGVILRHLRARDELRRCRHVIAIQVLRPCIVYICLLILQKVLYLILIFFKGGWATAIRGSSPIPDSIGLGSGFD